MTEMRVLLVTSSYPRDPEESHNAGVLARAVAHGFAGQGDDVVVVTPQRVTTGAGEPRVVTARWFGREESLTHVDPGRLTSVLRLGSVVTSLTWCALRTARRERRDATVALWAIPSGISALVVRRLLRRPYVVWVLGSDIWKASDYPFGRTAVRAVLRGAVTVFADGRELAERAEAISGVKCEFLPSSRVLPEATVSPSTSPETFNVLSVGRFHPHKGMDVLIDAVGRLEEGHRERLHVRIAGFGPDEDALRAQVDRLALSGVVDITGPITAQELADELAVADLAVVPSRLESIPLVLSDIAQSGCPMVVTETGDMGRLVDRFGAGTVVEAGNAAALSAALAEAMKQPLVRANPGGASLAEHLSLGRSVDRLREVLASELGRRSPAAR